MTPKQHRNQITKEFARLMLIKYAKGQKEHKDHLWERTDLLDMAIEEVVDLAFYLITLKQQAGDRSVDPKTY